MNINFNLSKSQINVFNEHGYIIIDNFLPNDFFNILLEELKNSYVDSHFQVRPQHYEHIFSSKFLTLPNKQETYIAKFSLLNNREKIPSLNKFFIDYIAPLMKFITFGEAIYSIFPAAVKLRTGDLYRAHQDSFAGIVGFTFFLNEGWSWDYGGILNYVRDEFTSEAIFPKPNRLLLRNESFKHFHFLNTIEQYCQKEQYLIIGWADKVISKDNKFSLGDYYKI